MSPFRPDPKPKRIVLKRTSVAWLNLVAKIFKRDGYRCKWCGRIFPPNMLAPCHKISVGAGGDDADYNLDTGCKECHGKDHNGDFLKHKYQRGYAL